MSSAPHTEPPRNPSDGGLAPLDRDLLGEALIHGLREPLAALRASLESLARGAEQGPVRESLAENAVEEVARLGRTVQDLIEFVSPVPLQAMRTTLDEVVEAALAALGSERGRVLLAVEHGSDLLHVDGPRLARCLSLLLLEALRSGPGEVLLHTSGVQHKTSICVTRELTRATRPQSSSASSVASLARGLAERELARLGGRLAVKTCSTHSIELALAHASGEEERAA
jgi:hypothetical protein